MLRSISTIIVSLLLISPAAATVRDTFTFSNVDFGIPSVGPQGTDENFTAEATSIADSEYFLGEIAWTGTAAPAEDPNTPGSFPSWGSDLSVRVTHDPSGQFADINLGQGFGFAALTEFTGSSFAMNGTRVAPGDLFQFEFYELSDDFNGPDAFWDEIEFFFRDNVRRPTPLPRATIRFSTQGEDTFPTSTDDGVLAPAANYFGVHFGAAFAGGFPDASILSVQLDLHSPQSNRWFDSDETGVTGANDGTYQAGASSGIETPPNVSFFREDDSTASNFSVIRLDFEPGDFTAEDWFRFGIDVDGPTPRINGAEWVEFDPQTTVDVLLDNGMMLSGEINALGLFSNELIPMSYVDLRLRFRADFDDDGDVDGDDFLIWQANFGAEGERGHGDANGDGQVDGNDFLIWQAQFGAALPVPPSPIGIAPDLILNVPEPAIAWLAGITFCLACSSRYRG